MHVCETVSCYCLRENDVTEGCECVSWSPCADSASACGLDG